ncbi:1-deoxy-D-xylulose-5-phosphate reductoisomerase [Enterobacteriaceae endosymbiont of Plateumaris consimilis]|uniref:1-deoxy-D-xylulose-5-phosphate reductoisomerase n=1 Tax=Enterobacteriaceae endosymbiont of Plateumaris consimilis TaxID=2675794 RepID=UPI001448E5A4|nr:1-deoxy-D-xylulose-5-phosphate reductoisomerase [Enterobacteriaceae endosymbiont of Plateumaris consimilis]QJC28640.1 1-deoxy-D-xylulose-5-phosphate reductoisomerase [Enterobacteriaceae endosymbiont of Plateumaris consimilis]
MKYLTILGSTGYIGRNVLSVVLTNPELFKIKVLVSHSNVELMTKQCILFNPDYAAMLSKNAAEKLKNNLSNTEIKTQILFGEQKIEQLASLDDVDQVIAAINGTAGFLSVLSAIRAGKNVLLANTELIVISGNILMYEAKKFQAKILPLNKNHSSVFQMMPINIQKQLGFCDFNQNNIQKIILTNSGGPFLHTPKKKFKYISIKDVCKYNHSDMKKKSIINSATMMNLGLEYIASKYLFNAKKNQIEIVIHPESKINAMVKFKDSSISTQLSISDIRVFIASMINWPIKINSGVKQINLHELKFLTFLKPDFIKYSCLKLAIEVCYTKNISSSIILYAANEIAIKSFIKEEISFNDISFLNHTIMNTLSFNNPKSIHDILWIDNYVRKYTKYILKNKFRNTLI